MNTANKVKLKVISRSWTGFGYCINCYNGCEHGCRYCYAMEMTHKPYEVWIKPTPRLQLIDWLKRDIEVIKQNPDIKAEINDIMICSITDCYQPLEVQHGITREVIKILVNNKLPFTVLTKSASVLRDKDLFRGYDRCKVGLTITTLDDTLRKSLEPNSSPIVDRIDALKELKQAGISTYCSVEPILPDNDPIAVVDKIRDYVDLFEYGKLNPNSNYQGNYNEDYYVNVFKRIKEYCDKNNLNYCYAGHSRQFLKRHGMIK